MSLGENLQFLRKKENITQEQLAEQLGVSRQSISKCESDTAYPEMEKLLQLCKLFQCTMDDLMQKEISQIYVEDKSNYDRHYNEFSKFVSLGIGLILLGLSATMLVYGLNYFFEGEPLTEDFCGIIFLIFLVVGMAILILYGIRDDDFKKKNPHIVNFYQEKEIDSFNRKFSVMATTGISLFIINVILLAGFDAIFPQISGNEYLESFEMSFFFLIVSIATTIIVYYSTQKDKYDIEKYNQLNDKNSDTYKKSAMTRTVCGCIMLIATILYLIAGFVFNKWGMPSVAVFAISGIGCAIASIIINFKKSQQI